MTTQVSNMPGVSAHSRSGPRAETAHWILALTVTLVLAFSFQGSRGLFEPDEGFYTNVAATMAATGDFWIPRLNGQPFLDKPPLHYWGMAAGITLVGATELGLRAAHALWFAGTAWLVGLLGARFWGPRAGPLATLAYAVMLAPFVAANVLTPDTVLTFWVTAMAYAYWRSHSAAGRREELVWTAVAGLCAGFGVLAKGPALLVFALPLLLHRLLVQGVRSLWRVEVAAAAALALIVGGSWYAAVAQALPGAAAYFFDNQVSGRLWSGHYHRNAGLAGPLKVYLPALVAGSLPWTLGWPVWLLRRARSAWRSGGSSLRARPEDLLLLLWIAVPLAILCLAQSRLVLYVLPVMPAIALVAAARLQSASQGGRSPIGRRWLPFLAAWALLLVGIKGAVVQWPTAKDTRRLAATLERLDVDPATPIVAVDLKCNALPLYGFTELTQARRWDRPYPFFSPPAPLEAALARAINGSRKWIFLIDEERAPDLLAEIPPELGRCRRSGRFADVAVIGCERPSGTTITEFRPPASVADPEREPKL